MSKEFAFWSCKRPPLFKFKNHAAEHKKDIRQTMSPVNDIASSDEDNELEIALAKAQAIPESPEKKAATGAAENY
jgi:hypothetical protein